MNIPERFAMAKHLVYGLANPVNQRMYDGVCSVVSELFGQPGYAILYENITIVTNAGGFVRYYLGSPTATYRELVELLLFAHQD